MLTPPAFVVIFFLADALVTTLGLSVFGAVEHFGAARGVLACLLGVVVGNQVGTLCIPIEPLLYSVATTSFGVSLGTSLEM